MSSKKSFLIRDLIQETESQETSSLAGKIFLNARVFDSAGDATLSVKNTV